MRRMNTVWCVLILCLCAQLAYGAFCPKCGENVGDTRFCHLDGTKIPSLLGQTQENMKIVFVEKEPPKDNTQFGHQGRFSLSAHTSRASYNESLENTLYGDIVNGLELRYGVTDRFVISLGADVISGTLDSSYTDYYYNYSYTSSVKSTITPVELNAYYYILGNQVLNIYIGGGLSYLTGQLSSAYNYVSNGYSDSDSANFKGTDYGYQYFVGTELILGNTLALNIEAKYRNAKIKQFSRDGAEVPDASIDVSGSYYKAGVRIYI